MALKDMPLRETAVDSEGRFNPAWIDWFFSAFTEINDKLNTLTTYSSNNLVKVNSEGRLEDAGVSAVESTGDMINLIDETGDITLPSGSWADLTWDKEEEKSSYFGHSEDSEEVEIKYTGRTRLIFYGSLYVSSHSNATLAQVKIQKDTGTGFYDVPGANAFASFTAAGQYYNFSVDQSINANSGDIIKCIGSITSGGSTIKTVADACCLKIIRGA